MSTTRGQETAWVDAQGVPVMQVVVQRCRQQAQAAATAWKSPVKRRLISADGRSWTGHRPSPRL